MGPVESECPERILNLLTETDSEYAQNWRARCRARLAERAGKPKVTVGSTIKFAQPLSFTDGATEDTFEVQRGRGATFHFRATRTGRLYRIPNYKMRDYRVVEG
jgi:hypothetical protein